MPTLTGSEKQIEWATELRDYAMQGLDALMRLGIAKCDEKVKSGEGSREDADAAIAKARKEFGIVREMALAHTDASWWIDNLAERSPFEKGRLLNIPSRGEALFGVIKRELKSSK